MPVPFLRLPSGAILVDVAALVTSVGCLYARVSSHDQLSDLDRQVARLTERATAAGMDVGQVVAEAGSDLNDKRPKLARILSGPCARVIVVEHGDRLARFVMELLHAALAGHARRIVVIDDGESSDGLVRVVIEVLSSTCACLYGRRGAGDRAMWAVTATEDPEAARAG
jgi:putative resolvase